MADIKISDLVELGGASLDDLLVIVDVDDTSMATSGTNKKIKASNATGLLAPLAGGEVSVTGATTATVGRMHVCSGTTADYTVTLPAASGNLGRLIGFRMAAGLTKLVTLDGNASETIDGAFTRVLWAGETAILLCDGSNWFKIAGKTRPLFCQSAPSGNTTVLNETRINLNAVITDNSGLMADTTNGRVYCKRGGLYRISPLMRMNGLSSNQARLSVYAHPNGNTAIYYALSEFSGLSGAFCNAVVAAPVNLVAGDYLELYGFTAGSSQGAYGDGTQAGCNLAVEEMPSW